jgi:Fe-S-cluster containining protein
MTAATASTRRLRIAILGASPCEGCRANCCRQNGHDYAVLLRADEVRKFAPFALPVPIAQQDGRVITEHVLPYIAGRCQFLGPDNLCTIYEDRPASCRQFECVKHFNAQGLRAHARFLQLNSDVLARLEAL